MAITLPRQTINGTCVPDNINPLSPLGFRLAISKLPHVEFYAQQVQLPGISIGQAEQATPFVVHPIAGEILTYDTLTVQFLVNETMDNYKAIVNWLEGLGFPEDNTQYSQMLANDMVAHSEVGKSVSDGTLQILGSNNLPVQTLKFKDMFPIGIEGLQFNSTESDVNYLIGNVTFRYTNWVFAD